MQHLRDNSQVAASLLGRRALSVGAQSETDRLRRDDARVDTTQEDEAADKRVATLRALSAEAACRGARAEELSPLPPDRALKACKGKKDFILFEDMDDAVRDGQRVVLVTLKGDGRALRGVQTYLAESLARWLGEQKLDGAGKPYGETKDQDPTLRKFFTRAQNTAIQNWGRS